MTVVCPAPKQQHDLLRPAHLLKCMPDEPTRLEFVRVASDSHLFGKRVAAYLLRRLVALHHHRREPECTHRLVHGRMQRRNMCLTSVPDAVVDAARARFEEDAAVLAPDGQRHRCTDRAGSRHVV